MWYGQFSGKDPQLGFGSGPLRPNHEFCFMVYHVSVYPLRLSSDCGVGTMSGVKHCRRCNRKLTNSKTVHKGFGYVCERKEKEEIRKEMLSAGFDGVITSKGVQMLLKFDEEGGAIGGRFYDEASSEDDPEVDSNDRNMGKGGSDFT